MSIFSAKPPLLQREATLDARPFRLPVLKRQELSEGGAQITVKLARPRWQRVLGSSAEIERSFKLDRFGVAVYDTCDGATTVKTIARQFARHHKVSDPEAELSVTSFFKTLMAKGLVAMSVEKSSISKR